MPWYEKIRMLFGSDEEKEGIIFKNARSISDAALAKAEEADLPIVTLEGEQIVKISKGGRHRRIIGKLLRRPRLLEGRKLEMP